jgi:RNA polymerase sigma-70 factor (ECF subfamily)
MRTTHDGSDEALFDAYLHGDQDAFAMLVRRWTPTLRAVLRRGVVEAAEVDELVQDVFLLLHRSARDFCPGRPLRPWILTIAFNLRRDHARRVTRRHRRLDAEPLDAPEAILQPPVLEQEQDRRRVQQALATLPAGQRQVVELRWFSDLSYPEIARMIGGTAGAVKVRAYRACERLRAALEEEPAGLEASAG